MSPEVLNKYGATYVLGGGSNTLFVCHVPSIRGIFRQKQNTTAALIGKLVVCLLFSQHETQSAKVRYAIKNSRLISVFIMFLYTPFLIMFCFLFAYSSHPIFAVINGGTGKNNRFFPKLL